MASYAYGTQSSGETQMPLKVKILNPLATAPTIAHPGEDLGYDVYALRVQHQPVNPDGTPLPVNPPSPGLPYRIDTQGKTIHPIRVESGKPTLVKTGIAVHFDSPDGDSNRYGLLVRDRSSMALKGLFITAGVIDNGYRGELGIVFNLTSGSYADIWPGDKIAQLIPIKVAADTVEVVPELTESERKEDGFGSTGQ